MDTSAVDFAALALGGVIAALVATTLVWAERTGGMRRAWVTAGLVAAVLAGLGAIELLLASPRETPVTAVVVGALFTVAGSLGVLRLALRTRLWARWLLVFLTAFVLLYGSLLLAVSLIGRLSG